MVISEIINNVVAGGLLGSFGQGVRIAVGLKKLNEGNAALVAQGKPAEEFSTSRLVISIFTAFVAGALGMVVKYSSQGDTKDMTAEAVLTIIAVGYSGADFIEGVFNTYISKYTPTNTTTPAATPPDPKNISTTPANEQPLTVADEAIFSNGPAQG